MIAVSAIISNNTPPLNPIEIAQSYARLVDESGLTHIEVARACGVGNSRFVIVKHRQKTVHIDLGGGCKTKCVTAFLNMRS